MPDTLGVADHAAPDELEPLADDLDESYPVEPKVRAATAAAATAAGIIVPVVLWLLSLFVFHGDVPVGLQSAVGLAITGACTLVAGYLARHVDRPTAD